jgi:RimJ/RimL family protein N-acetyltransferase
MKVIIRKPNQTDATQLATILCQDNTLRSDLGIAEDNRPTAEAFLKKLTEWCRKNNSETYAIIINDDDAIGTISLSHIDTEKRKARMGYWIGSIYRKKGYCSQAVTKILELARVKKIDSISAKIADDNPASFRIWKKLGAEPIPSEKGKTEYKLQINSNQL